MTIQELIGEFIIYLVGNRSSEANRRNYHARFRRFLTWLPNGGQTQLLDVTASMIDQYGASLSQSGQLYTHNQYRKTQNGRLSPHSIYAYLQAVKTLFAWATQRGHITNDPAKHLRKPRLYHGADNKLINRADLNKMLSAAARHSLRDLVLICLIADTGCRRGEVATLSLGNLYLEQAEAIVNGKTGIRKVFYTQQTATLLQDYITQRGEQNHDFLFINNNSPTATAGTPMTPDAIYNVLERTAKRAGIRGRFNPHAIRHLVGQNMADHVNLALVQQKLGHSSITTTGMIYSHQDNSRVKAATTLYSLVHDFMEETK